MHRSQLTNKFECSVYRKETFSGLGTSYSRSCFNFKLNGIRTLFDRAYKICTNYNFIHSEFEFLTNFSSSNGFPRFFIESRVLRFWKNVFESNVHDTSDNTLKTMYFSFPYFGSQSEKLKEELRVLIEKYFLNTECKIVLVNKFTVGYFFNYKDKLPAGMRASLVYKFSCALCASTYIGSSMPYVAN